MGPLVERPYVRPDAAGRVMLGVAGFGFVVSVVAAIIGWQVVGELEEGLGQSLEVTAGVLATVDESFVLADDALVILGDGVGEAETAVRALSRSMQEGQAALDGATELTGGDVADALESVEASLPAIQSAASTIDRTLGALSSIPLIGLDYDPERPLGETIGELRRELQGLPDELRSQAEQVEATTDELREATRGTAATADALAALDERLDDVGVLIGQYAGSIEEARAIVDDQRDGMAGSTSQLRWMILAVALAFALAQFVPFYLGTTLVRGASIPVDPGN